MKFCFRNPLNGSKLQVMKVLMNIYCSFLRVRIPVRPLVRICEMAGNLGRIEVQFDLLDDIVFGQAMFFDKLFNRFKRLL
jgi:hypothetical protein